MNKEEIEIESRGDVSSTESEDFRPKFYSSKHSDSKPLQGTEEKGESGPKTAGLSQEGPEADTCMNRSSKKIWDILAWVQSSKVTSYKTELPGESLKQIRVTKYTIVAISVLFMVVGGALVIYRSCEHQRIVKNTISGTAPRTEPLQKNCRQIGTIEECSRNQECRWVRRTSTCGSGYIATVQLKEVTSSAAGGKPSEVYSGTLLPRSNVTEWQKEYLGYLDRFRKPRDRSRLEVYQQNVEEVIRHNNNYNSRAASWWKDVNDFTDMNDEELNAFMGYNADSDRRDVSSLEGSGFRHPKLPLPKSLDYREKGIVSPVKHQDNCGSSFAFAAVAGLESKFAMLNGESVDLSEQDILDCSREIVSDNGCNGGSYNSILKFMQNFGVSTEANNPYKAMGNQRCKGGQAYHTRLGAWSAIEPDEESMMEAISNHGPTVTSLTVDREFFSYGGGVFTSPNHTVPNHAVIIVGYGQEDGTHVWYIKNSWGSNWGQEGFMAIQRNVNLRGIAEGAYAIVSIESSASRSQNNVRGAVRHYVLCLVAIMHSVSSSSLWFRTEIT